VPQVKKVAPPAVPDVFRHSGSSFGSAGYSSSEDGCFITGSEGQPPRGKPSHLRHFEINRHMGAEFAREVINTKYGTVLTF